MIIIVYIWKKKRFKINWRQLITKLKCIELDAARHTYQHCFSDTFSFIYKRFVDIQICLVKFIKCNQHNVRRTNVFPDFNFNLVKNTENPEKFERLRVFHHYMCRINDKASQFGTKTSYKVQSFVVNKNLITSNL